MANKIQQLQISSEILVKEISTLLQVLNVAVNSEGSSEFKLCTSHCHCNKVKIIGFSDRKGFTQSEFADGVRKAIREANESTGCVNMNISESETIVVLAALLRVKEAKLKEVEEELSVLRVTNLMKHV